MNRSADQPGRYQREYFCLRLCKLYTVRNYTSTKVFIHPNPWTLPLCLPDIHSSYLYSLPGAARTNHPKPGDLKQWKFILSQLSMLQAQDQGMGRAMCSRGGSRGHSLPLPASGDSRHWHMGPSCNLCPRFLWSSFLCIFSYCLL